MLANRQFAGGVSAVFEEAPGGGDVHDIASLRNRPAASPVDWLANILFHADFDYYQVALGPTDVTINHAAVAGVVTTVVSKMSYAVQRAGQIVKTHYDLVTHDLGYVPRYMVISGSGIIAPGSLIQVESGRDRVVTPYATTTKIRLLDIGTSSASTLSAMSKTYTVLVFRQPAIENAHPLDFDADDGGTILGRGKFDSRRKMLRVAGAGDSAFDIPRGPTSDINGGAKKTVQADGTTVTAAGYAGSFTGSPSIQCAVE